MKTTVSAMTHVGRKRQHNEDSYFTDEKLRVFAVCDGLGGQAAGEVASRMACDIIRDYLLSHLERLENCRRVTTVFNCADIIVLIRDAVQAAHEAIRKSAAASPDRAGMACTLVLMVVLGDHITFAHLGDSRAYLCRRGRLHALTRDHNYAIESVHSGSQSLQEMMNSNKGARITRCLGSPAPLVDPDVLVIEPMNGDTFLLCSDGVTTHLGSPDILDIMTSEKAAQVPEILISECNACGGVDNITAVVVGIEGQTLEHDKELASRIAFFRRMPIFSRLDLVELTRIFNRCQLQKHKAGDYIITDGADDHRLFVCLSGHAEVRKKGGRLASVRANDAFGEMALLENALRSADVVADKPTTTLAFAREDFVEIMRQEPWMAIKMLFPLAQHLNHRLRRTNDKLSKAATELSELRVESLSVTGVADTAESLPFPDPLLDQTNAPGLGDMSTSLSEDELQAFETALYGIQSRR